MALTGDCPACTSSVYAFVPATKPEVRHGSECHVCGRGLVFQADVARNDQSPWRRVATGRIYLVSRTDDYYDDGGDGGAAAVAAAGRATRRRWCVGPVAAEAPVTARSHSLAVREMHRASSVGLHPSTWVSVYPPSAMPNAAASSMKTGCASTAAEARTATPMGASPGGLPRAASVARTAGRTSRRQRRQGRRGMSVGWTLTTSAHAPGMCVRCTT
uniref:Uncharacterized protein n=1 Tax=Mantoniella antarctica TaxID=81844 RepID=A0A7S0S9Z5_9CHLO